MFTEICLIMILLLFFATLILYSKEGDISILTGSIPSVWKLKKMYPTKKKIIQRLHDLLIYKTEYVKWNKFAIIALTVSFMIVYYFRQKVKITELLFVMAVIFLAIDLPNRWGNSHIANAVSHEATILYTLFSSKN